MFKFELNRRMPNGTYGGVRGEREFPLLDFRHAENTFVMLHKQGRSAREAFFDPSKSRRFWPILPFFQRLLKGGFLYPSSCQTGLCILLPCLRRRVSRSRCPSRFWGSCRPKDLQETDRLSPENGGRKSRKVFTRTVDFPTEMWYTFCCCDQII